MSPEQEQLLCDALVHLGPVESEQGLHAEGVRKIQEVRNWLRRKGHSRVAAIS
jgi:hypothetical protein